MANKITTLLVLASLCSGCIYFPPSFKDQPTCPSINEDLSIPTAISPRPNPLLSLKYTVVIDKSLSGDKTEPVESTSRWGYTKNCFLPYGIRQKNFEHALSSTLRSSGYLAFDVINPEPNFILDARIVEQSIITFQNVKNKGNIAHLSIKYTLLRYTDKEPVWSQEVITEHEYSDSSQIDSQHIKFTAATAFEDALRLNLQKLLDILDQINPKNI